MTLSELSTLQHLADCKDSAIARTHGVDYVIKNKYIDTTANGLTAAVIAHIKLMGGHAERVSNEGRVIDTRKTVVNVVGQQRTIGSIKRVKGSGRKGTSDVHATISGRSVKIEIKMKDQQSDAQREYQSEVERAGGVYVIVRSFKEWINEYEKIINL